MRRILIIASTIVVLLGIGVALYFYISGNKPSLSVATGPSLPGAGDSNPTQGTPDSSLPENPSGPTPAGARLFKIDTGPVVPGVALVDVMVAPTGAASTTAPSPDVEAVYIARQSGNVFSYLIGNGNQTRISNRTVPGIEEASWLPDASLAFARYLSGTDFTTLNTYAITANGGDGFFLPQNIDGLAVSSSTVLTIASGSNGSVGALLRADGTQIAQAFTTPLSSIRASFAGTNRYLVFTKASALADGYAFLVDSKGTFSRIAGPLKGLVALASPSGKFLLVSYIDGSAMKMELVDTTTHEITALPIATIADKCVWTSDESSIYCGIPIDPSNTYAYPDDWYQGAAHFSDQLWKIDVAGRFAQLTLDFPTETKTSLDATSLAIDPNNQILVFVNKNDGSLWSFKL